MRCGACTTDSWHDDVKATHFPCKWKWCPELIPPYANTNQDTRSFTYIVQDLQSTVSSTYQKRTFVKIHALRIAMNMNVLYVRFANITSPPCTLTQTHPTIATVSHNIWHASYIISVHEITHATFSCTHKAPDLSVWATQRHSHGGRIW